MTPSERSTEYAVRIIAAPLAPSLPLAQLLLSRSDLPAVSAVSFDSSLLRQRSAPVSREGLCFRVRWSFVLPGRWRVGGALVLIVIGIAVHMHMMRSYTSDPQPPLWPLFAEIAGGLIAVAVQHIRRPRNES